MYKLDSGFRATQYRTYSGLIPARLKNRVIAVDYQTLQDLRNYKLMWKNGTLVENPEYEYYAKELAKSKEIRKKLSKISELKHLLLQSDFRAIKYVEGFYDEDQFRPYRDIRQTYRSEINRLELSLVSSI